MIPYELGRIHHRLNLQINKIDTVPHGIEDGNEISTSAEVPSYVFCLGNYAIAVCIEKIMYETSLILRIRTF